MALFMSGFHSFTGWSNVPEYGFPYECMLWLFSHPVMPNTLQPMDSLYLIRFLVPVTGLSRFFFSTLTSLWFLLLVFPQNVNVSLTYYNSLGHPNAFMAFNIVYMFMTPNSCLHMNLSSSQTSGSSCPSCMSSWMSIQFSSVAQLRPTLCDPMYHSNPGLPVHCQLPEFTQTHVHWVGDAIQPSHPLSSPSLPAPNPSQHQGLFQWVSSSHWC